MSIPGPRGLPAALRTVRLARGEGRGVLLVAALGLLSAVFEGVGLSFLVPLASMMAGGSAQIDESSLGGALHYLQELMALGPYQIVLLIAVFFICGTMVGYVNNVVSTRLAMRFAHGLRASVFEDALRRPVSTIESLPQGKFVNTLASETWRACDALLVVVSVVVQGISVCVFAVLLFLLSPLYSVLLGAMTLAMTALVYLATRSVRRLGQSAVAANEAFMAHVWDAIGGLRVIRGFGCEDRERQVFRTRSEEVGSVFVRLGVVSALVGPITRILTVMIVAALVGIAFARGDDVAALAGFLAIAYRMQPRVAAILAAETKLRELEASVEEIERALEAGHERFPRPRVELPALRAGIVIEGVSARYPSGDAPALVDVSCAFPRGAITAVAGYSGAGKSTLVALLLRFLEPERGRIMIDDTPLAEASPRSWHRRIAFVEQNAFLFNATVRENIAYGADDPDPEDIRRAARMAQAEAFIETLPKGFDTMIGDNGFRLSQGQRQRIALARAIIRRPDVLILDEATNALDRPSEEALRGALEAARKTGVVIVIAHRRETIENVDRVIVLDRGRVVEAGTPAQLQTRRGVFARLYAEPALATEV